jgi:hypothetical protein
MAIVSATGVQKRAIGEFTDENPAS